MDLCTATGKTEVHILAIAPQEDIYVKDRVTGVENLFWIRYPDVKELIARYERYTPTNTLAGLIWDDYFK